MIFITKVESVYCAVNAESLFKTNYVFVLEGLMLELLELPLYQNVN